jgi:hypothetical protein
MTIARIIEGRRGAEVISCDSNDTMREAVALLAKKADWRCACDARWFGCRDIFRT